MPFAGVAARWWLTCTRPRFLNADTPLGEWPSVTLSGAGSSEAAALGSNFLGTGLSIQPVVHTQEAESEFKHRGRTTPPQQVQAACGLGFPECFAPASLLS